MLFTQLQKKACRRQIEKVPGAVTEDVMIMIHDNCKYSLTIKTFNKNTATVLCGLYIQLYVNSWIWVLFFY